MRNRLPISMAVVLTTLIAGAAPTAAAWELPHLTAFAARQELRDEVCVAQADGRITRLERYIILTDARSILKPEEYEAFKRAFYRLASQERPAAKHTARRTTRQPAKVARKAPTPVVRRNTVALAESSPAPTISTEVVMPHRVVVNGGLW